jgi:hypothetical protein
LDEANDQVRSALLNISAQLLLAYLELMPVGSWRLAMADHQPLSIGADLGKNTKKLGLSLLPTSNGHSFMAIADIGWSEWFSVID